MVWRRRWVPAHSDRGGGCGWTRAARHGAGQPATAAVAPSRDAVPVRTTRMSWRPPDAALRRGAGPQSRRAPRSGRRAGKKRRSEANAGGGASARSGAAGSASAPAPAARSRGHGDPQSGARGGRGRKERRHHERQGAPARASPIPGIVIAQTSRQVGKRTRSATSGRCWPRCRWRTVVTSERCSEPDNACYSEVKKALLCRLATRLSDVTRESRRGSGVIGTGDRRIVPSRVAHFRSAAPS